jgi:hypothetical protein
MTIIDTTLYADGALRLSRHGAGRGGNVLMHVASGQQCNVTDRQLEIVERRLADLEKWEHREAAENYALGIIHSCKSQPPVTVA